jgi:hypothetical protein
MSAALGSEPSTTSTDHVDPLIVSPEAKTCAKSKVKDIVSLTRFGLK